MRIERFKLWWPQYVVITAAVFCVVIYFVTLMNPTTFASLRHKLWHNTPQYFQILWARYWLADDDIPMDDLLIRLAAITVAHEPWREPYNDQINDILLDKVESNDVLYQEFVLENYFNGSIIPNRRALKKIYNDFQKAKEHYNSNHYKYDVYCRDCYWVELFGLLLIAKNYSSPRIKNVINDLHTYSDAFDGITYSDDHTTSFVRLNNLIYDSTMEYHLSRIFSQKQKERLEKVRLEKGMKNGIRSY